MPQISVIIPTRNRGNRVVLTLESILGNDFPDYELIIVDQSENDLTESAVRPFVQNPRVRYVQSASAGSSRAQNQAIRSAFGELIALTDDDCQVSSDWLRELDNAFTADPRIGIVLGNVHPAPHDHNTGFIHSYRRSAPLLARSIRAKHRVEGIGANLALRQSVWCELGGFDELLGAGAPLKAAWESDFVIRTLLAGYFVYETPRVTVTHFGFRTWEQGRSLIQGYILGLTAMYVKHFKCGHWSVAWPFLHLVWRWAFQSPVVDFGHFPSRGLRLKGFAQGLWAGLRTPVDRARCLYQDRVR